MLVPLFYGRSSRSQQPQINFYDMTPEEIDIYRKDRAVADVQQQQRSRKGMKRMIVSNGLVLSVPQIIRMVHDGNDFSYLKFVLCSVVLLAANLKFAPAQLHFPKVSGDMVFPGTFFYDMFSFRNEHALVLSSLIVATSMFCLQVPNSDAAHSWLVTNSHLFLFGTYFPTMWSRIPKLDPAREESTPSPASGNN